MKLKLAGMWIRLKPSKPPRFEHENPELEENIQGMLSQREKLQKKFKGALETQLGRDVTKWELVEDYSEPKSVRWYFQKRTENT